MTFFDKSTTDKTLAEACVSELGANSGGTPLYGLYRDVPWNRVWVLRFSVLKKVSFLPFCYCVPGGVLK